MTTTALILAADAGRGGQDPGAGLSALLIALVVVGVIVLFAAIFFAFHLLSSRSRGGVEPRPGEFRDRGRPPFESIARRR
ncbi:MAG TPA: hypothetical protein VFG42_09060 [Baekduia sp.]|uniref:hypothetical protein n=1 Tax=Baekduia sp. TaxID=2600305 RepID=UPI002D78C4A1|nr:hypothetical protein [Baekduia sp.]HET6506926.1 hypothetical protein [Baekduia sp.]